MDRSIYTAMSGAKALMQRQETLTNNLANVSTNGFRADLAAFRSVPVRADGTATTRVSSIEATTGFDPSAGPMLQTGRDLDVAVAGAGWLAVQGSDGTEGYTRQGSLVLSAEGTLMTANGLEVVGDGGAISIPPGMNVSIGDDGTVSAHTAGQPPMAVGKLKLVNPPVETLKKGADGLMRGDGGAEDDPTVRVAAGYLEGSNVNAVEAMVGMIDVSRQFEIQMKLLQTMDQNDQRATQLLSIRA